MSTRRSCLKNKYEFSKYWNLEDFCRIDVGRMPLKVTNYMLSFNACLYMGMMACLSSISKLLPGLKVPHRQHEPRTV